MTTIHNTAILYWPYIARTVERILATLDGLNADQVNWRPLPGANSLYVIATHVMGNVEANLLGVLCGQVVDRQREAEFMAAGESVTALHDRWKELDMQIGRQLEQLRAGELERMHKHPTRGEVTGLEILLIAARHAAEHLGEAELTRDLIVANQNRNPSEI